MNRIKLALAATGVALLIAGSSAPAASAGVSHFCEFGFSAQTQCGDSTYLLSAAVFIDANSNHSMCIGSSSHSGYYPSLSGFSALKCLVGSGYVSKNVNSMPDPYAAVGNTNTSTAISISQAHVSW